jgi:hypothetical protein
MLQSGLHQRTGRFWGFQASATADTNNVKIEREPFCLSHMHDKKAKKRKVALNWGAKSDIMLPNTLSNVVGRSAREQSSL